MRFATRRSTLLVTALSLGVVALPGPALAARKPAADTTRPTVAVTSPTAGATVSGTVGVTGTAGDNKALAKVELQVDGGAFTTASGTTSWSTSVATAGLPNGSHTLTARATDTSGNTASASVSVTVSNQVADTTPPAVAIATPTASATVTGSFQAGGTASDNTSLAGVQVRVDSGPLQTASGTASWSAPVDTSGLAAGTHALTAVATDAAGNSATTTTTFSVAAPSSTDVVLSDPAATNGLQLIGRGRAASRGSTSVLLYWEEQTSHRGAFFRDATTGVTSYVALPVDTGAGWSNAAYALTSATDLWVLGGNGPMDLRHFTLSGSGLPTAATLVSHQVLGDSDSRQGDLLALASGGVVLCWLQQGVTGPQGTWIGYLPPGGGALQVTGPLQYVRTKASKAVLVQHPVDGSVWLFSDPDAWGAVAAAHLSESAGGLQVDWTNATWITTSAYGDMGPDPENPDLEAAPDPATGTVVLAYQGAARKTFSTSPTVVTGSYPVVARIPATGTPTFSQLPTYVERISSLGLTVSGGDVLLAYRPVDPATLTFDHLWTSVLRSGSWLPATERGVLWSSYDRISSGVGRPEVAARLSDGLVHLLLGG